MGTVAKIVANQATTAVLNVPKQSKWKRVTDVPLTRANYLDLLNGYTPLIKEAKFLTTEKCKEYEALMSRKLTPYKHNTGPLLTKYGVAQFGYQAQAADDFSKRSDEKNQYFADAAQYLDLHSELASAGLDAWTRVFNTIKSLFPDWDVEVASEMNGTRKYFSGIFRALNNATHVHCDYSPYDSLTEDWIINQVEAQIVFNLYLAPDVRLYTMSSGNRMRSNIVILHDVDTIRFLYGMLRRHTWYLNQELCVFLIPGTCRRLYLSSRSPWWSLACLIAYGLH